MNDAATVARLVNEGWGFMWWCVNRHIRQMGTLDPADVVSDGMYGLFRAAREYDPTRCNIFINFAALCIKWEIVDGMRRRCGRDGHKRDVSLEDTEEWRLPKQHNTQYEEAEDVIDLQQAWSVYDKMSSLEQWVMTELYVHGRRPVDIAAERGTTQAAVSHVKRRAVEKMQRVLKAS